MQSFYLAALLAVFSITMASADTPPTPPDFAFAACEAAVENDSCEVTTPRGDTLVGTCRVHAEALACVPDRPPHRQRRPRDDEDGTDR